MKIIARIHSDFPTKFGIPRQSGVVETLKATIEFEQKYRNPDAVCGLGDFSHIWLIWQFSEAVREGWSPTVRPPRLGGNARMGVFATRSPFRPNPIGLSCVKLDKIELTSNRGPVLYVSGADLMDGTPIFDIKPYIPYADSRAAATGGFTDNSNWDMLHVEISEELSAMLPTEQLATLKKVLSCDPRPTYQKDPGRIYGFAFAGYEIKFTVSGDTLTVVQIVPEE